MICFKDKAFCSDSNRCANERCNYHFGPEEQEAAEEWWGEEGAPVAFMSRKATCGKFKEITND